MYLVWEYVWEELGWELLGIIVLNQRESHLFPWEMVHKWMLMETYRWNPSRKLTISRLGYKLHFFYILMKINSCFLFCTFNVNSLRFLDASSRMYGCFLFAFLVFQCVLVLGTNDWKNKSRSDTITTSSNVDLNISLHYNILLRIYTLILSCYD